MNKQELRDGYVVKTRNGKLWLIWKNRLHNKKSWGRLVDFDENLKHGCSEDFDIVRVGEFVGFNLFDFVTKLESDIDIDWIWKRKENWLTSDELEILLCMVGKAKEFKKETFMAINNITRVKIKFYNNGVCFAHLDTDFLMFEDFDDDVFYNIDDVVANRKVVN